MSAGVLDPAIPAANQGLASLGALAAQTFLLAPPLPHELPHVWREEAAPLLDGLLVRVARGRGALDVAIGEGLASLKVGDRVLRLGFSGIGDYAFQRLRIAAETAKKLASLAGKLRDRPLLRDAVRRGEVSARKALAIASVARGDAEATWVERARAETVRALEDAVRKESAAPPDEEEEAWDRLVMPLSPEGRAKLDEAMELAGNVIGAAAPKWRRLEAICQEYLASNPAPPGHEDPAAAVTGPVDAWVAQVREYLEKETRRWELLPEPAPVAADTAALEDAGDDPFRIDEELRRLARMRDGWDELVGHLAMLMRMTWLWKDMYFASFSHYAVERLGMSGRAVGQRASLARRLYSLPSLRQAMRDGRLSYEQARLVARAAEETTVDAWISRAEGSTCIELRRAIERAESMQMCARALLHLPIPRYVRDLLSEAFRAARAASEKWISLEGCLVAMAEHFICTWKPLLPEKSTLHGKVLARDGGLCQVPCCSRAADHDHHLQFRSRGGGDELANQTSSCLPHHLHGLHLGYIRAYGRAPYDITWELGVRRGLPPLLTFEPTPATG